MPSTSQVALSAGGALLAIGLWKVLDIFLQPVRSSLRNLPGPPSNSWIFGNTRGGQDANDLGIGEGLLQEYGQTLRYYGLFNTMRLFTLDLRALNYVLAHPYMYARQESGQRLLRSILGDGLLVARGEHHHQQRRILNPAFGPSQIRALTTIFVEKSAQLRDGLLKEVAKNEDGWLSIDALAWLNRVTLDIIGVAGFNNDFGALNLDQKPSELSVALTTMLQTTATPSLLTLVSTWFPFLQPFIRTKRAHAARDAQKTMLRLGKQLIAERKAEILASSGDGTDGKVTKSSFKGRDLLSLLVRANMAEDLSDSQRLSDYDILAQIPTFLVAGHETTSSGTAWVLYALTQHPEVQSKLRAELLNVTTDEPSMDELQALPYLDAVSRECLRLHAPVRNLIREANQDDVIPLDKPFVDRNGLTQDSVKVRRGDRVVIPIAIANRAKSIWGDDAHEFKPERWQNPTPNTATGMPGVWSHLLTFSAGPRACIGYRFSLVEMKALLFFLVRTFEFELGVDVNRISARSAIVTRPIVQGEPGAQLPIRIRRYVP